MLEDLRRCEVLRLAMCAWALASLEAVEELGSLLQACGGARLRVDFCRLVWFAMSVLDKMPRASIQGSVKDTCCNHLKHVAFSTPK